MKKQKKSLEEKYNLVKKRKEELKSKYRRALADYQNLQKQSTKEKQEFAKYANENLLHDLIPVYDNLKTSLEHFPKNGESSWLEGIKYVVKQFGDALTQNGIEEIDASNKKFDYNTMEAMEGKGEKVKKVIKNGYKLNGKVVIPAKVILE